MKSVIILSSLFSVALATNNCLDTVRKFCTDKSDWGEGCTAHYGPSFNVANSLSDLVQLHITTNFNYLLMSTHFGNFEENREGLEKLFRHLSNKAWSGAIDLIKYMNKRGFTVNIKEGTPEKVSPQKSSHSEIGSLALALDLQKKIAVDTIVIHQQSLFGEGGDPEVASFLENEFLHKHANVIRNLAGLTNDVHELLKNVETKDLSVFIFDEYLKEMS